LDVPIAKYWSRVCADTVVSACQKHGEAKMVNASYKILCIYFSRSCEPIIFPHASVKNTHLCNQPLVFYYLSAACAQYNKTLPYSLIKTPCTSGTSIRLSPFFIFNMPFASIPQHGHTGLISIQNNVKEVNIQCPSRTFGKPIWS